MTDSATNELHAFQTFLQRELAEDCNLSLDEAVEVFRERQREIARLRQEIDAPAQRWRRGEGSELDYERLKEEVTRDLKAQGIGDS